MEKVETERFEIVEGSTNANIEKKYQITRRVFVYNSSQGPVYTVPSRVGWFTKKEALEKLSGLKDSTINSREFFKDYPARKADENLKKSKFQDLTPYVVIPQFNPNQKLTDIEQEFLFDDNSKYTFDPKSLNFQ